MGLRPFAGNPAGQIASQARSNDAFAWTGAVDVARTYGVNGLNQYTVAGSAAFCYDANGNLTADGSSVFLYDIENRLVEKRAQGAGNTNCAALSYAGALQASLRYDPMGRLYEVSGTGTTTRMLYDGDALTLEYDSAGNVLRRYVHGADLQADDPIAWYEGAGFAGSNERQLRSDWQGSIVLVTDSTAGSALALNRYDEYGIPQSTNAGRFQYTGQAWLAELGMYYYKARIYSPTLGRFLQTDPIGYKDQVNLYAYVGNDPVDNTDPTGLECYLCVREVIHNDDGTVTIRSNAIMRALVPGQVAWDNAVTSWANGDKKGAAVQAAVSTTEIVATVATAGLASRGTAAARAVTAATRGEQAVQTTAHGAERIAGAGATKGGVLSAEGVQATRAGGQTMTQADGASVFVAQGANGRFNVVVQNKAGKVITTFENI